MADGFAVVTGASSGIGYELAACAAGDGYELLIVADEPEIRAAGSRLAGHGRSVETLVADLASPEGRDALWKKIGARPVDLFFANAGRALGHAFHEQSLEAIYRMVDLNVAQTTILLHRMVIRMNTFGKGRILVTGSIAGYMPGPYDAVYNATKAYLDSLCIAVREELGDAAPSVTCLMPGPTDTLLFDRAGLGDAAIAEDARLGDASTVAQAGYDAMMAGKAGVVPGVTNRLATMFAGIIPNDMLARIHAARARQASD
ncbi:MAG: SDR family NAD(P)-dependent oxidoreductase [Burkholderiaceae bacterium]